MVFEASLDTQKNGQAVENNGSGNSNAPILEVHQSNVSVWQKIRQAEGKDFGDKPLYVDLIWDVSGSMAEKQNCYHPKTKHEESIYALRHILSSSPLNTSFAFRLFGQDPKDKTPQPETSFETRTGLLVPFGEHNFRQIISSLENIKPAGNSDMPVALREAVKNEVQAIDPNQNNVLIVAVTDGEINDPEREARRIRDQYPLVQIILVYLDNELKKPEDSYSKDGITVIHANSMDDLARSVQRVVETGVRGSLVGPKGTRPEGTRSKGTTDHE